MDHPGDEKGIMNERKSETTEETCAGTMIWAGETPPDECPRCGATKIELCRDFAAQERQWASKDTGTPAMTETTDTDCRLKEGHRYIEGRCVWCDAIQEVRDFGIDLTGTVLDDGQLTEEELRQLQERQL